MCGYPIFGHLPVLYADAEMETRHVQHFLPALDALKLSKGGHEVAIVAGARAPCFAGDLVPPALEELGSRPHELTDQRQDPRSRT
jgi:hypothetical protein